VILGILESMALRVCSYTMQSVALRDAVILRAFYRFVNGTRLTKARVFHHENIRFLTRNANEKARD
jgi:hypothetical protein